MGWWVGVWWVGGLVGSLVPWLVGWFHKYCCCTKHEWIITKSTPRNHYGYIADMPKYHNMGIWISDEKLSSVMFKTHNTSGNLLYPSLIRGNPPAASTYCETRLFYLFHLVDRSASWQINLVCEMYVSLQINILRPRGRLYIVEQGHHLFKECLNELLIMHALEEHFACIISIITWQTIHLMVLS